VGGDEGHTSRNTRYGNELADGHDNVIVFLQRLHAKSAGIFTKLGDEDLKSRCKIADGADITKWK
jgi:hypothetical protein